MVDRGNSEKKREILKLFVSGETDVKVIGEKVGASEQWVRQVLKGARKLDETLPATLESDLALGDHLAEQLSALVSNDEERVGFAKGVKAMLAMQAYDTRLLGQLMTIPTQSQRGQLEEILTIAKAMESKPSPPDPALLASLNGVSQSLAKMAAPKTPEMAILEMISPLLQNMMARVMGGVGVGGQPGQPQASPWPVSEASPGAASGAWTRRSEGEPSADG